jgi:hypothetical protein
MEWLSKMASDVISEFFGTSDTSAPKELQRSGILTEKQLENFFRAASKVMESADVKSQLRLAAADGQDVCDIVTEIQVCDPRTVQSAAVYQFNMRGMLMANYLLKYVEAERSL